MEASGAAGVMQKPAERRRNVQNLLEGVVRTEDWGEFWCIRLCICRKSSLVMGFRELRGGVVFCKTIKILTSGALQFIDQKAWNLQKAIPMSLGWSFLWRTLRSRNTHLEC